MIIIKSIINTPNIHFYCAVFQEDYIMMYKDCGILTLYFYWKSRETEEYKSEQNRNRKPKNRTAVWSV